VRTICTYQSAWL